MTFPANNDDRGGGGGSHSHSHSHPPPYDSLGRQTLCRNGSVASAAVQRRWRPADGWGNDGGGDGGDGGSNTDDDEAWAEQPPGAGAGAGSTRREDAGEPRRVGRGREHGQVRGTVAARRFAGEPLREPFSGPFSGQEKGADVEGWGSGVEGRQDEKEGEGERGEVGRGAAVGGGEDKGEEGSLDDRLPFMLASLKRVALTVQDLQGRCARLSHGEMRDLRYEKIFTPRRHALFVFT